MKNCEIGYEFECAGVKGKLSSEEIKLVEESIAAILMDSIESIDSDPQWDRSNQVSFEGYDADLDLSLFYISIYASVDLSHYDDFSEDYLKADFYDSVNPCIQKVVEIDWDICSFVCEPFEDKSGTGDTWDIDTYDYYRDKYGKLY